MGSTFFQPVKQACVPFMKKKISRKELLSGNSRECTLHAKTRFESVTIVTMVYLCTIYVWAPSYIGFVH